MEDQDLEETVSIYQDEVRALFDGIPSNDLTESQRQHLLNANNVSLASQARTGANDPACKDTNAGSFHIVMTNEIGLNRETFLMDKTRDAEIWNQPVHHYESMIIRDLPKDAYTPEQIRNAAPGTVRMVEVDTKLYYADDTDYGWSFWNPTLSGIYGLKDLFSKFMDEYKLYQSMLIHEGDLDQEEEFPAHVFDHAHYRYLLEMDSNNHIIGGQWISLERPDDLYLVKLADFGNDFHLLGKIYRPMKESKRLEMLKSRHPFLKP